MLDPTHQASIWLIWRYLSTLERLFFVALMILGLYVLSSAALSVASAWKARSLFRNGGMAEASERSMWLRRRSARVDRLITTALYLFGLVLFLGLQDSYFTTDSSRATGEPIVLRNFSWHLAFASNVFFVLLVLHVVAWFISSCVGKLALQPTVRSRE